MERCLVVWRAMPNLRLVLSLGFTAATLAALAIACDDSNPESGFAEGPEDAAAPDTGSFVVDSGGDSATPVDCTPALPSNFTPSWAAPTKASACSAAQLGEYFDKCLAGLGSEDPDAGDPCEPWITENGPCASCIAPENNSGPVQWHQGSNYEFYTMNVAGCLALERGETAAGQCPATYAAAIQCQRESCATCLSHPDATFDDFQGCQTSSKTAVCAALGAKVNEVCGETYNDPDGGAYDCFRKNGEDAKTHFVRVEGIFCGQ